MYTLTLNGIMAHHFVLLVDAFLIAKACLSLKGRELGGDIGQHEELGIVHLFGQPGCTLICEVAGIQLLVDDEVEGLHALRHTTIVVLHIDFLGLQHTSLDTFLREVFNQGLVFRHGLMRTVEREETLIELLLTFFFVTGLHQFVTCCDQRLGISKILCGQLFLYTHEALYQRLVFLEHLVVALWYRTRNNERGTGIVDQHGVDLVDDGVVMGALHKVGWRNRHIVTQIVETELIVGTKGNISLISLTTRFGVGLVLVDTVDTQTMEHIERTHPLRVTLGQIVVYRDDVNTITSEGIEKHGEGSHKGLTFTSGHLGNLSLMENETTK